MAYCSYCAAVLDPIQTTCPRCGRPAAIAPIVSAPAAPTIGAVTGARPSDVRLAGVLLLISCLVSFLSFAGIFMTSGLALRMPSQILVRTIGLLILWLVLTILVWQRQGWARIAILVLIAWSLGNLLLISLRLHGAVFALAIPLLMDALRAGAAFLLFKPESNAWFKK